ncbi:MAG: shikimate kinase [Candidatus Sulfotelmatobacter sp.]
MGAGKSTVGSALAARLDCAFEDLDDRVEQREKRSVSQIFRDSGETQFRRAERAALRELLKELRRGGKKVAALGGGAFTQVKNAELIEASCVPTVLLDAPVDELWRRCCRQARDQGTQRPLLHDWESFRKLYEIRLPKYLRASVRLETNGKDIDAIVADIVEALSLGPRKLGPRKLGPRKLGPRKLNQRKQPK